MKYQGWTIEKSGFNYRVRKPNGEYLEAALAASVATARKWIDAELQQQRDRARRREARG